MNSKLDSLFRDFLKFFLLLNNYCGFQLETSHSKIHTNKNNTSSLGPRGQNSTSQKINTDANKNNNTSLQVLVDRISLLNKQIKTDANNDKNTSHQVLVDRISLLNKQIKTDRNNNKNTPHQVLVDRIPVLNWTLDKSS